jgi:hypothetical protein
MIGLTWYRSTMEPPAVGVRPTRAVRNWMRSLLPEPKVENKTMVLGSRRTFPALSLHGLRTEFHGLFSEFHSVLGALAYAQEHGASAVRVAFQSPLYVDRDRGPNWWEYFFITSLMPLAAQAATEEVHLNGVVTKFGRYGGFADIVQGETPYLYPMTYGLTRAALNHLVKTHIRVRNEIQSDVDRFIAARFEPGVYIVGVHYRGTDATHNWTGTLSHYRRAPVPYSVYSDEVRRALEAAGPRRFLVFVATDEIEFLEHMQREFGDNVIQFDQSPRVRATSAPIHLDRTLHVSGYQKGASVLIDSMLLAATHYLVKGRSNVSDASLVFNPDLPYSFCPDVSIR